MLTPLLPDSSVKTILRATQILCAALMIGVVVFALVILVVVRVGGPSLDEEGLKAKDIFLYASAGLGVLCFVMQEQRITRECKRSHLIRDR
jgi:hypothetical protein